MQRSTHRILTTHVGSLARPDALMPLLRQQERGQPYEPRPSPGWYARPWPTWSANRSTPASILSPMVSRARKASLVISGSLQRLRAQASSPGAGTQPTGSGQRVPGVS